MHISSLRRGTLFSVSTGKVLQSLGSQGQSFFWLPASMQWSDEAIEPAAGDGPLLFSVPEPHFLGHQTSSWLSIPSTRSPLRLLVSPHSSVPTATSPPRFLLQRGSLGRHLLCPWSVVAAALGTEPTRVSLRTRMSRGRQIVDGPRPLTIGSGRGCGYLHVTFPFTYILLVAKYKNKRP